MKTKWDYTDLAKAYLKRPDYYNKDLVPNAYKSYLEFIDTTIWKGMGTENQNRIVEPIIAYRGVI